MIKLDERWNKIREIINSTTESAAERILIVPMEDWNPTILSKERRKILLALRKMRPTSEKDLAKILKRKRPNVVSDLKLLEHYGLIKLEKIGKSVVPRITKTHIMIY